MASKHEHKRPYRVTYAMPNESLADFEAQLYTADEEVASTKWMYDCGGIHLYSLCLNRLTITHFQQETSCQDFMNYAKSKVICPNCKADFPAGTALEVFTTLLDLRLR